MKILFNNLLFNHRFIFQDAPKPQPAEAESTRDKKPKAEMVFTLEETKTYEKKVLREGEGLTKEQAAKLAELNKAVETAKKSGKTVVESDFVRNTTTVTNPKSEESEKVAPKKEEKPWYKKLWDKIWS